jgi:hypothetical protein
VSQPTDDIPFPTTKSEHFAVARQALVSAHDWVEGQRWDRAATMASISQAHVMLGLAQEDEDDTFDTSELEDE